MVEAWVLAVIFVATVIRSAFGFGFCLVACAMKHKHYAAPRYYKIGSVDSHGGTDDVSSSPGYNLSVLIFRNIPVRIFSTFSIYPASISGPAVGRHRL